MDSEVFSELIDYNADYPPPLKTLTAHSSTHSWSLPSSNGRLSEARCRLDTGPMLASTGLVSNLSLIFTRNITLTRDIHPWVIHVCGLPRGLATHT